MMLPDELEWVLEMLGYKWPTANEDKLRDCAVMWRQFGEKVTELHTKANNSARTVTAHNAGESIDKFTKTYEKFDGGGGQDGYLRNAAEAAFLIANVLESCAYLVEFAKWAVIAQLIALAIQIAAAAAAAPVTFGLSSAAGLGATQVARMIVRRILDELKQAMIEALIETMKEPAISAVEAMISDLVRQTVNVGFGAQEGYDVGATMKAGGEAGLDALRQSPQTFAEGVRDSLGHKAGSRTRDAIDGRVDGYDGPSGLSGSDNDSGGGGGKDSGSVSGAESSSSSSDSSSSGPSSTDSSSSGSSSSGSDSSTSTRNGSGPGAGIGGGISADTGDNGIGAPDVGAGPNSDSDPGSNSGGPSSSDSPYSRPVPSAGPSLSDFDDPAPGGTSPGRADSDGSSGTPSTPGPSHSGGGSPVSGLSSPTAQSAPPSASSGGTASSPGGGSIGTQIDGLAASTPTQSNAAPTPTAADSSPAGTGGRSDGGSAMPTSPTAPSTGGATPGTHHGPSGSGGTSSTTSPTPGSGPARNPSAGTPGTQSATAATSPTSPNTSNAGPARNPSAAPPGTTASAAGTGPASTPSPTTSSATPRTAPSSTPSQTPDPRIPGSDGRTPGTAGSRVPNQNTPDTTPGDHIPPRNTPGTAPGDRAPSRDTPGTTPGDRTPNRDNAGTTPGDRTAPRNNADPAGARTPGQNPNQPTANQNPAQSSPSRTPSASTNTPTTTPSSSPNNGPDRASTPSNSTQGPSIQPGRAHTPGTPPTPGTSNQPSPGTGSTPPRPHQPAGHTPNTPPNPNPTPSPHSPQQPAAQPHKPENTPPDRDRQHQQQQVTAVPIHTVVTTPASSQSPSHADPATPQQPGSPQATPNDSNNQKHPQQDSLDDIRADLDQAPGGLSQPDPADQQALVDTVPHNEDGTPERFPDPFGPWTQLQNDGGNTVPGRSNNCADCSRSFLETWYGNPQVSAPRTVDLDENGKHNPFTPENNANDNQIRWTGAAHTYAGPGGDPSTANSIASTLQQAGPGSAAIVQVDWPGGGGHAFNVVNHNGKIVWIDTQSGEVSDQPLHIDKATHVWHIPLDADRNPIDTSQSDDKDSEDSDSKSDESQDQNGVAVHQEDSENGPADQADPSGEKRAHTPDAASESASSPADGDREHKSGSDRLTPSGRDDTSPAGNDTRTNETAAPGSDSTTAATPESHAPSQSDRSDEPRGQDRSSAKPSADERTDAKGDTRARSDRQAETTRDNVPRGPRNPAGQDAVQHGAPSDPAGDKGNTKDPDDRPYTDPHDRGTSDTSAESRRVTEGGPDSDVSRTHETPESDKAKEYGIEPDELQQGLRRGQNVHRVELDRVHTQLDRWAESGALADVMRATTGNGPQAHPDGSRSFTRDQLINSLPGFGGLSRGEQHAVVASLARLSLSFHQEHAVGRSPERIPYPYRNDGESAPDKDTPDRGAKLSKESLGVRLHRMAMNALFKKAEFKALEPDKLKEVKRHGPDFSGKNYAVLEVKGPPPKNDVHYIVDSSVPANKELKGVQPRHSERHLLDWLKRMDPDGSTYTPLGLYTEREPCGEGQGHAKCSDTLQDERLKGIPIHYSTTYRDDPVGVATRGEMSDDKRDALKQMKGRSDQECREIAEEIWREHYKDDQAGLDKALKKLEDKSGDALRKAIRGEFDAQRKATTTHKEAAIKAEFDRHINALQGTWKKLRADIQG
ncbi:toxin glutamine deamidase domain-containing protein [Streptomyces sp. NRRL S-455]|uniref:toxin glutamine deamidase domain-containing protein n=1 Tax=Streptomyces sp. NRRL S-455 TaxID=1463908 RepID=UPI00131A5F55|nr:toxin glutamine deamidase domain-containing protein [Streptomyces sp. NRRL S-455]